MKKLKIIVIFSLIFSTSLIFSNHRVSAVFQSNGDAPATATITNWMWYVRNMQAADGGLGRTDEINSNLTTTQSTNFDIHMEKNTEYGAMALLSASQYGKPTKVEDGETTTGNSTGIVMNINKEWVAAGVANFPGGSYFTSSVAKYKNIYPGNIGNDHTYSPYIAPYTAKTGDAILNWHGSTSSLWIGAGGTVGYRINEIDWYNRVGGLLRSYSGSIFSYYGYGYSMMRDYPSGHVKVVSVTYDAYYTKSWATRAVIVFGNSDQTI